jgi:hypothetical protein
MEDIDTVSIIRLHTERERERERESCEFIRKIRNTAK